MRGAPWLACLIASVTFLAAVPLFAENADAETSPERSESRDASSFEPGRPRILRLDGQALMHFKGACLDGGEPCVAERKPEGGQFFLPSHALDGTLVVSWRPANDSLRTLRVSVDGLEQTGESPLRFFLPGLNLGEHRVIAAPTARIVGAYDQVVDWTAVFDLDLPPAQLETHGMSTYGPSARCVLAVTCDALTERSSTEIVAPWRAQGVLEVKWDARQGPQQVCLRGTARCVEGDTPLTLAIDGLEPGSYRVDANASGVQTPLDSGSVEWTVRLRPG